MLAVLAFLALILQVSIRLILASVNLTLTTAKYSAQATQKSFARSQRKSADPKASDKVRNSKVAVQGLTISLNVLKALARFMDWMVILLFSSTIVSAIIVVAVILLLVVVALSPILLLNEDAQFLDTSGGSGVSAPGVEAPAGEDPAGGGTGGTEALPAGMDPASWATADALGQKTASAAIWIIGNPPSGVTLTYAQRVNRVGVYDCVVFAAGALSMAGTNLNGGTVDSAFDPHTQHKGDLLTLYSGAIRDKWRDSAAMVASQAADGAGWESKLQPGDLLSTSGHIVVYLGKNAEGVGLIAHAGSPGSKGWSDPSLANASGQVVIAKFDSWDKYDNRSYIAIRPSLMMANPK